MLTQLPVGTADDKLAEAVSIIKELAEQVDIPAYWTGAYEPRKAAVTRAQHFVEGLGG